MRLIDAEELEKSLTYDFCGKPLHGNHKTNYANIRASILAQPTIDPETLPIVQKLKAKTFLHETNINELRKQLADVTAEKNAAVEDLRTYGNNCNICLHFDRSQSRCIADEPCGENNNWKWRGKQR